MMYAGPLLLVLACSVALSQAQVNLQPLLMQATTLFAPSGGCLPYPCSSEDFVFPDWENCAEYYACRAGQLFKGKCTQVLGVTGDAFFSPLTFSCSTKMADASPCQ